MIRMWAMKEFYIQGNSLDILFFQALLEVCTISIDVLKGICGARSSTIISLWWE